MFRIFSKFDLHCNDIIFHIFMQCPPTKKNTRKLYDEVYSKARWVSNVKKPPTGEIYWFLGRPMDGVLDDYVVAFLCAAVQGIHTKYCTL